MKLPAVAITLALIPMQLHAASIVQKALDEFVIYNLPVAFKSGNTIVLLLSASETPEVRSPEIVKAATVLTARSLPEIIAPKPRRSCSLVMTTAAPEKPLAVSAFGLLFGNRTLSGSLIGGVAQTQEMLDFCGQHNLTSDVGVIPIQKLNEAYERMLKSDVKYRFSIDMASLK